MEKRILGERKRIGGDDVRNVRMKLTSAMMSTSMDRDLLVLLVAKDGNSENLTARRRNRGVGVASETEIETESQVLIDAGIGTDHGPVALPEMIYRM